MHFYKILILFFIFTFKTIDIFSLDFNVDLGIDKDKKEIFYNEKTDCDNNICKKDKNYAKIGAETYSQEKIWNKFYVGLDINWHLQRFGDELASKYTLYSKNFWDRFKNLDIYIGYRMFKYFGLNIGYSYFGNVVSKTYDGLLYRKKLGSYDMHGIFIDTLFYTPALRFHTYTSIEGYLSVGGVVFFSDLNNNKGIFGAKFGGGLMIHVYGPFAINVGVDYYFPLAQFSNKGMITVKTGFNFFLNV